MAQHALDGDVAEVLFFSGKHHSQCAGVKLKQFFVADEAEESYTRIVGRELSEYQFVLSRARDQQGRLARYLPHRANRKVHSLPAMQPPGKQEILLPSAVMPGGEDRRINHLGIETVIVLQALSGLVSNAENLPHLPEEERVELVDYVAIAFALLPCALGQAAELVVKAIIENPDLVYQPADVVRVLHGEGGILGGNYEIISGQVQLITVKITLQQI